MILHSEWSLPRVARCAHPHCRTSLTEDDAVQCPHGLTFCQHCVFEDGCTACDRGEAA